MKWILITGTWYSNYISFYKFWYSEVERRIWIWIVFFVRHWTLNTLAPEQNLEIFMLLHYLIAYFQSNNSDCHFSSAQCARQCCIVPASVRMRTHMAALDWLLTGFGVQSFSHTWRTLLNSQSFHLNFHLVILNIYCQSYASLNCNTLGGMTTHRLELETIQFKKQHSTEWVKGLPHQLVLHVAGT